MKKKVSIHVVIGVIFAIRRRFLNFSQTEQSELLNINNSTLSKIEKGKISLSIENFFQLLSFERLSLTQFIGIVQIIFRELSEKHTIFVYSPKHLEKNALYSNDGERVTADTSLKTYLRYSQPIELYRLFGVLDVKTIVIDPSTSYWEILSTLEESDHKEISEKITPTLNEIFDLIEARVLINNLKDSREDLLEFEYGLALKRYEKAKEQYQKVIDSSCESLEEEAILQRAERSVIRYKQVLDDLNKEIADKEDLMNHNKYKNYQLLE